ncbi:hypothetical protein [Corynebacterium belfantii]|uniref:hypothetical protein n=1 Tax=Corynebacterium belfantii TaxID=2014537 RepID=UPI001F450926|nr:hypothetical protein [Corynebacterium belfantii]
MAQRPQGTFVSLSESDKEQLRRLIAGGLNLYAAVQEGLGVITSMRISLPIVSS